MLKTEKQALLYSCLYHLYHFEEKFFKKWQKVKRVQLINSLKPVPSISGNSIQSSASPKIPLPRRSPRKWIFQEDKYSDFVANDTISILNYITK